MPELPLQCNVVGYSGVPVRPRRLCAARRHSALTRPSSGSQAQAQAPAAPPSLLWVQQGSLSSLAALLRGGTPRLAPCRVVHRKHGFTTNVTLVSIHEIEEAGSAYLALNFVVLEVEREE